jgi:hypothetical protein
MPLRIVVADYSTERLEHLAGRLRARFDDVEVFPFRTSPYDPAEPTDHAKLAELKANKYDMLIAHIGGNPSGYECLRTFKTANRKGKAVLYTKMDAVPLQQFEGLKLADAIVRRDANDSRVFANDDEMLEVVNHVRRQSSIVYWINPFKDPAVATAIITLAAAVVGLVAAIVALYDKS